MDTIDLTKYRHIVVLTGAGISVASGLRPYRGPGGLWEESDFEKYAHLEMLNRAPLEVWRFFGPMRDILAGAQPNPAHLALAEAEARLAPGQTLTLVTQNIDGLHRRAGSRNVIEYHGTMARTRCTNPHCDLPPYADSDPHTDRLPLCPRCGAPLRPDIVLFGEMIPPEAADGALEALAECDLFIAVGTSGTVYPAAGFIHAARYVGARTVYVNLMAEGGELFGERVLGKAEEVLPRLLGTSM